jgi:hypothetical protein
MTATIPYSKHVALILLSTLLTGHHNERGCNCGSAFAYSTTTVPFRTRRVVAASGWTFPQQQRHTVTAAHAHPPVPTSSSTTVSSYYDLGVGKNRPVVHTSSNKAAFVVGAVSQVVEKGSNANTIHHVTRYLVEYESVREFPSPAPLPKQKEVITGQSTAADSLLLLTSKNTTAQPQLPPQKSHCTPRSSPTE